MGSAIPDNKPINAVKSTAKKELFYWCSAAKRLRLTVDFLSSAGNNCPVGKSPPLELSTNLNRGAPMVSERIILHEIQLSTIN